MEVIGRGWDSTAYLVNGELVVRIAHVPDPERTRREVELLCALQGRVPVAIPEPVLVADDDSWFAYRYLAGEQLTTEIDVDLWCDVVAAVAATELELPSFDPASRLELVERARDAAPQLADRVLAEYVPRFEAARSRAVPMHGDLGVSHFLADEQGRPYAVTDWSDACHAPVEHEIAHLYWTSPQLVVPAVARFDADAELVLLDHWANALADLGAGAADALDHLR